MLSAIQIGKALRHAAFPIRNIGELHAALQYHLKVEEHYEESEISRMESLFSPRDLLFTNAGQVQRVLEARQEPWLAARPTSTERMERTERRR